MLAVLLGCTIHLDILSENQYPGDLRNRVVGARLQKDGKLPYTYHWTSHDGVRYFDFGNINVDSLHASNITASPFYHELLFPICELPERTISAIWFILEYFFLTGIILLSLGLAKNLFQKWLIINTGILFTFTQAWSLHIWEGQLYIFEAFLMSCIIYLIVKNRRPGILIAGILASVFILVRPIGIVLLLPFISFYKRNLIFILTSIVSLTIYCIFVLINPMEKKIYQNYFTGMKMQTQMHQASLGAPHIPPTLEFRRVHALQIAEVSPNRHFEGFDLDNMDSLGKHPHFVVHSENGNLFVFYHKITGSKLSVFQITLIALIILISLPVLFFVRMGYHPPQNIQRLLLGFTLYILAEMLSPVHRAQYNTVQWFPLILVGLTRIDNLKNAVFFLIVAGLIFGIVNTEWLLMRHTLGELCWLTAILLLAFSRKYNGVPDDKKPVEILPNANYSGILKT